MALGRLGVGVAVLFTFAGSAVAEPFSSFGFGSLLPPPQPVAARPPAAPPAPAYLPADAGVPAPMPPGAPTPLPPGAPTAVVTPLTEDHPPVKELPTGGLPDLIPPPAHGAHAPAAFAHHDEVPGYMTPFIPGHGGWYTSGEFLLMRPRNSDFDYAIQGAGGGLPTVGPIQSLKYGMGTGFRAEAGRRLGESGLWDAGFAFTYFTANEGDNSQNLVAPAGGVLFPTLTRPGLTDRALTASAAADLDYTLYDMIVGRRILVDEHFGVRLFGGGRFADIRQTFNTFYDGADARNAAVRTRSHFQGFGPIVGGEAVLVGWKGFHLYTRASAGLISGRDTNQVIETNDAGATTYVNTSYNVRKVVPVTSMAIGGGWQYRTFFVRGGYEVTYWQGLFERPRFVDDVSQGKVITRASNLTLEGLFLQIGLNF